MDIHIGGNTELVSMGRTNEANVGEPGVTTSDTGFFRAYFQRFTSLFAGVKCNGWHRSFGAIESGSIPTHPTDSRLSLRESSATFAERKATK